MHATEYLLQNNYNYMIYIIFYMRYRTCSEEHRSKMRGGLTPNSQVMSGAEWLELLWRHVPSLRAPGARLRLVFQLVWRIASVRSWPVTDHAQKGKNQNWPAVLSPYCTSIDVAESAPLER